MSTEFTVIVKATSIQIQPGSEAAIMLQSLLDCFTYEDEYVEETKTLGFLLDTEQDVLYLHKGVDLNQLKRLLVNAKFINFPYDPYKPMDFQYEEIIPPRNDEQIDVINFIAGLNEHASNAKDSQIFLVKKPGFGKTFCSGVGLCKYGVKTLIIMHRDSLRQQWIHSLFKMNGFTSREVHEIKDSNELYQIAHNQHDFDYDVYLMTHATFRAGIKRIGSFKDASNITKNLGIGMKIIDEAHLEFRDTLIMDFVFNVKRNLYLTATDGRSSRSENSIFRHVFANTTFYKPSTFLTTNHPRKWVEYTTVEINTHVKPAIYKYKVAGGRGMSSATYGKWVIQNDKQQTHFKVIRDLIKIIYNRDSQAKVLVFLPLIELCTECAYYLNKQLNYDESFEYELNIKTINSKNSKQENESNKHADVIVTTIASCGTGTDIPGVTGMIVCSPIVSRVNCIQIFGRMRFCGKTCYYYDVYDASVPMDRFWLKARIKTFKQLALNTKELYWTDDETPSE